MPIFLQHPAKPAGFGLLALSLSLIVAAQQPSQPSPTYKAAYQKWLDEDVRYLISDQERSDFNKLASDEQRDIFIEGFWRSRNPEPGSSRNLFKEEHYRRLAYVNSHYASSVPGYKTDRGRIYIVYGPPSSVDRHFSAAGSENLPQNDKSGAVPIDWELWHYPYIDGIGKDVNFKFVDICGCGEYRIPVYGDDLKRYSPR